MHRYLPLYVVSLCAAVAASVARADEGTELFERKIRPALIEHCFECHSAKADKLKGGLRLDHADGIRAGGESGPSITAGKSDESLLFDAVSYNGLASEMPPKGKLPDRVIAEFRRWIDLGAPLPDGYGAAPTAPPTSASDSTVTQSIAQRRDFWSFQPVKQIATPAVDHVAWPRKKIDYFILQKLETHGMRPAGDADRRTLIRRAYFDLSGLPPSDADAQAFINDESLEAWPRLIDRLLASPRYGERWGRHWLDVARYAEDNPTSEATCKPPRFPFRYRDWVVRAINDDLPYDEFVRRQLAADLMDLPPPEIAALGFLGLSPVYHKEPKLSQEVISVIVADEWDERIDAVTRGFLGLTVACARCHDHKFDPITSKDYYALAGVMASTQLVEWPLTETSEAEAARLTETRRQLVDYELRLSYARQMRATAMEENRDAEPYEQEVAKYQQIVDELKSKELFEGPIADAVRDAGLWIGGDDPAWTELDFRPGVPRDLPVFLRGSVTSPGEIVPRRFLEVLSPRGAKPFELGSGRRELAECIVGDAQGLAARVIVNRVWGWHFDRPLVGTPSNFGELGDRPSHPELLDDLSARFIENGWSLKWLHREIMGSAAYRQASRREDGYAACHEVDPDNRLLWRMNRRRLEAEELRDALLAVGGRLDLTAGGPSVGLDEPDNHRRTVYGTVTRQRPPDVFRLFDFPDPKRHGDQRQPTTTPLQQLYLLNSPFVAEQASSLIEPIVDDPQASPRRIARAIFRAALQREPARDELRGAMRLAAGTDGTPTGDGWTILAHSLLASNEFLFVD
jgi:cytochrome c553